MLSSFGRPSEKHHGIDRKRIAWSGTAANPEGTLGTSHLDLECCTCVEVQGRDAVRERVQF